MHSRDDAPNDIGFNTLTYQLRQQETTRAVLECILEKEEAG